MDMMYFPNSSMVQLGSYGHPPPQGITGALYNGTILPTQEVKSEQSIWTNVQFMSYSKCSNWHLISKLSSNFGCLFTFCYLDGANSIKTDLHVCNLWTGQFVSYKSVI